MTPTDTPPCPDCGGQLTETAPGDDSSRNAYDCSSCGWGWLYDEPLTVATAPWTREVWAEVERLDAGATELYHERCAEEDRADRAEREVARLTPLLADAERLVARLSRVLAVERGDASAAPEGWRRAGPGGVLCASPVERDGVVRWNWSTPAIPSGSPVVCPSAPTALEAMEAADRAAKEAK